MKLVWSIYIYYTADRVVKRHTYSMQWRVNCKQTKIHAKIPAKIEGPARRPPQIPRARLPLFSTALVSIVRPL